MLTKITSIIPDFMYQDLEYTNQETEYYYDLIMSELVQDSSDDSKLLQLLLKYTILEEIDWASEWDFDQLKASINHSRYFLYNTQVESPIDLTDYNFIMDIEYDVWDYSDLVFKQTLIDNSILHAVVDYKQNNEGRLYIIKHEDAFIMTNEPGKYSYASVIVII